MSRIGDLKEVCAMYGGNTTTHYVDGPNAAAQGFGRKPKAGKENHVIITLDFESELSPNNRSLLLMHLNLFYQNVHRAYFTKKSNRLKVIFSCRNRKFSG